MTGSDAPTVAPSLASRLWATQGGAEWAMIFVGPRLRLVAGRLSEVTLCDARMWRVEVPCGADGAVAIRIFHPSQVREIQPCSEARVRAEAALQPRSSLLGPSLPGVDDEPF